jgi:hypothetical protein
MACINCCKVHLFDLISGIRRERMCIMLSLVITIEIGSRNMGEISGLLKLLNSGIPYDL